MAGETTKPSASQMFYGNTSVRVGVEDNTNKSKLFKNIVRADKASFKNMTPFITGRGYFVVIYMPEFMKLVFANQTELMQRLTQFYVKGISGFQDLALNTITIENGIEAAGIEIPAGTTGFTKELTFQYGPELKGQFITKYMTNWLNGMSDPNTKEAHYHGAEGLEFGQENHTMAGIYFETDPQKKYIEYTALCLNMMPKNAPGSGLKDFNQGDNQFVEPAITYSVQVFENNVSVYQALMAANILGYFATDKTAEINFNTTTQINPDGSADTTTSSGLFNDSKIGNVAGPKQA